MTDDNPVEVPAASEAPAETPAEKPGKKTAAKKAPAKKAAAKKAPAKKAAAKKAAADEAVPDLGDGEAPAKKAAKRAPAKKAAKPAAEAPEAGDPTGTLPLFKAPATVTTRPARKTAAKKPAEAEPSESGGPSATGEAVDSESKPAKKAAKRAPARKKAAAPDTAADEAAVEADDEQADDGEPGEGGARRRRRRGGRRRRKPGDGGSGADQGGDDDEDSSDGRDSDSGDSEPTEPSSRRRRTRERKPRAAEDQITALAGSTRLEAKKQRRREGREAGRRRAPIVSEAEFLARRESVDRVMVVRQRDDLTQIGVLEDKVLVEHYVARESQTSLIGNVYLGRVQNVLPSMEAAFIDIGRGRNAVLYAGEVNWSALGHKDGQPRKVESVLSSGQSVLVQVTKDPMGHKGARLTSQISLAGRFLVYVPDGTTSGISRKLPDTERNRLKTLLKEIVPDTAGVIVRTAAEGASEEELTRDVERLKARWEDIEAKTKGNAPQLLYGEPDLTLKVVRDLFTEDFAKLVIQGPDAWETVQSYVAHVAPDLEGRLERYDVEEHDGVDLFAAYRVDEQIAKGLDRKVWLPSGGSLVIDRTEAMTVVDVNTGKFTGSGGNLEETVTKNNLEAAEEVVRQLRLRDIGGIIVVDFIDMVLESNRDLVLRRMVECLGRDRTRHQVAEVTSLGLVQMTRKRIGTGLLEAFSETCEHCQGRGLVLHDMPVESKRSDDDSRRGGGGAAAGGRRGRGRGRGQTDSGTNGGATNGGGNGVPPAVPTPKDVAAMAREHAHDDEPVENRTLLVEPDGAPAAEAAVVEDAEAGETPAADAVTEAAVVEPVEPVETPAAQPPAEPEPEPEPEDEDQGDTPEAPPAPPEPPRVVTRTRRRGGTRTAGHATVAADVPATVESAVIDAALGVPPTDGLVEPGTADAEPAAPHVPVKRKGRKR
jgi:ribonuclease E